MEEDSVVSLVENRALTPDEIGLLASLIVGEVDHYTVLGVTRNASSEEIQEAYCLAVEYFHPLKSRKITESDSVMHWKLSSAFVRIEDAFTVLSHRTRRKVYDEELVGELGWAAPHRELQCTPDSHQHLQGVGSLASPGRLEASAIRTPDLRRVQRIPLNLPLRVSLDRNWQELTETMNVSPLGIRFRLSRPVEPGSELRLELPMPTYLRTHSYDDDVYVVSGIVIYRGEHDGRHVAAEFL